MNSISTPPYTSKNQNDTFSSLDGSTTSSPGGNRSRSFSITDILADDNVGSRKRSNSSSGGETSLNKSYDKMPRVESVVPTPSSSSQVVPPASNPQLLSLIQAGNLVRSSAMLPAASHPVVMNTVSYHQNQQLSGGCYYPLTMMSPSSNYYTAAAAISALTQSKLGTMQSYPITVSSNTSYTQLQENLADLKIHNQYHYSVNGNHGNGTNEAKKDESEEVRLIETTPESSRVKPTYHFPSNYFSMSPLTLPNGSNFSPSIFLTCPSSSSSSHHITRSPQSVGDEAESVGGANMYMTSTPIRKYNQYYASPSRVHSPIVPGEDNRQDQSQHFPTSEYSSSSSDSEMPLLRRPRVPRRRAKARTSLSPLLENTSPLPPPGSTRSQSNLLTSYKLPHGYPATPNDSGIVPDQSYRVSHHSAYSGSGYHVERTPVKTNSVGRYAKLCESSPVTEHLNKTGQIQSIPPWFVCSDKKTDGKRSRLTEAINKSLSENLTQRYLPAEWKKLAYGQTDDQKNLTRKARNFLKGRPRVLKFESSVVCGRR